MTCLRELPAQRQARDHSLAQTPVLILVLILVHFLAHFPAQFLAHSPARSQAPMESLAPARGLELCPAPALWLEKGRVKFKIVQCCGSKKKHTVHH